MVVITIVMAAVTGTAFAQTIDAPASNDPVVNSPFYLQAEAPTCAGLPTASMAYSYDSNPDNVFSGAQSIQTMVTISNDNTPTLRVKAWNTNGALCEKDLSLNIGGGVVVSSPAQGGNVSSPFTLQAQAPTCGGQTTTSMAYAVDSTADTIFHGATSINTSVTAAVGWHILRVKAWGSGGAYCETDDHIYSSGTSGIVPPANATALGPLENDGTYSGAYASCGGATGPHADLWQTQPDCATYQGKGYAGPPSGSTTQVSSPVYGGNSLSREFTMSYYHEWEGVRWFDSISQPPSPAPSFSTATHFLYDVEVYIPDVSQVYSIEMDVNHSITSPTSLVYILAAQCGLGIGSGVWQVTSSNGWVNTNVPCTRSTVTSGSWHHFQILTHHDTAPGTGVHYDQIAVDGVVSSNITCTNGCDSTAKNLGWGATIGPNFQLDGQNTTNPPSTATAYVGNFTLYYW